MVKLWLSIKMAVLFLLAVLWIISPQTVHSEEYRAWTGEFMRMGAGARAMGMGNAYSAVEGDIYSSYFNPAGLSSLQSRQMSFSFRYLTMDRMFRYFAIGSPIGPDAGFALSWINAGTDDITGRDLNGNPTGSLHDDRNAFTVTFSKYINKFISIGLNSKLAYWKLENDDAKSFGFDIGILLRPYRNLTTSFVVRDARSRFTWKSKRWEKNISDAGGQPMEKEDTFPVYYTAGAAYNTLKDKLLVSSTIEYIEDNPLGLNFGVSYVYNKKFILRTGIYHYTSSDELDSGAFTAGFSLKVTESINFDYAYTSDNIDDDAIHIVAFMMSYGELEY